MKKRVLLITASAIIVCIVCFVIFASLNDDGKNDSKLVQGEFEANTEAPIKATVDAVTTTTVPTMEVSKKPTVQPEETQEPTVAPVETIAPTLKPTETINPTIKPTVNTTKKPTEKPKVTPKPTVKPTIAPKTKKPSVVGDGYVDPYTGKWFESEEAFKEWCKEELAKQTPTPVPRTETEKKESKYYSRKGTFKLAYDQEGYLDIKNTILGLRELDDEAKGAFFDSKEIKKAMEEYSNVYNPWLELNCLQKESYEESYPYYDIRDYQFGVPIYHKDGTWAGVAEFYIDKNFKVVKGEHPALKYDMGYGCFNAPDISPDRVEDNNPNHYKKDIIKFVYNDDGSPNIKESIMGENVDFLECCIFIGETKDVKGIEAEIEENYPGLGYSSSLSLRQDIYPKYYYDIRDYEISFTVNEIETTYYWNKKFSFVERK